MPRQDIPRDVHRLSGCIAAAGFETGDRFVVGHWTDGPIGPMTDVMWAKPSGERILLAPNGAVVAFVKALYEFEETRVVPIEAWSDGKRLVVRAGDLVVDLRGGLRLPVLPRRPLWVTRWIERPVAARLIPGVSTFITTPRGCHEWYQARWVRPVRAARATIGGQELGPMRPIEPKVGFGASEPPQWPAMVRVDPALRDPSGGLDRFLRRVR